MNARLAACLSFCALLAACSDRDHGHEHANGDHGDSHGMETADFERGPHRGRLLRDGNFAVEVTIFESGVDPQFRLFAYLDDQPLAAADVAARIELSRLGGQVDRFSFRSEGDYLVGDGTVVEPHSFDVVVEAEYAGQRHRWSYDSYEGRTMIPAAVADAAGVTLAQAGPAIIRDTARLPGRIVLNRNRYAAIKAPFAGPVLAVSVASGDRVRRGQVLATIENRESLVSYPVLAPMDGVVLARHTNVGDVTGETPIFEMADLSSVWLEVHAFSGEAARLQVGQPVRVQGVPGQVGLQARLTSLLPVASAVSQSVVARAELPNPDGLLRPGMSVTAEVELDQREVPLAVNEAGLQRFRDFTVVFARFGDTYEVRMLELGERDGEWVEVLGGIDPGTPYVVEQSFLIKADVEKSGASHDH